MQKPSFRKDWSGGYHNYTRPINKINQKGRIFKAYFTKKYLKKKQREHCKSLLAKELNNITMKNIIINPPMGLEESIQEWLNTQTGIKIVDSMHFDELYFAALGGVKVMLKLLENHGDTTVTIM